MDPDPMEQRAAGEGEPATTTIPAAGRPGASSWRERSWRHSDHVWFIVATVLVAAIACANTSRRSKRAARFAIIDRRPGT
jgi:hypothetical protein